VETEADQFVVYYNPSCSKARGAVQLLREHGVEPEVIEYLKRPPSRADLERIVAAVPDAPRALVRKDKRFAELGLDHTAYETADAVVALLLEHPELMERPVVFRGTQAVIARPSEKVLELLD